jgi:hypothetical protein
MHRDGLYGEKRDCLEFIRNEKLQILMRCASLDNTLLYIQVEQAIFGLNSDDEYSVQATNNKEDIKKLLSVGFEYVCQKDDLLYFRKRK